MSRWEPDARGRLVQAAMDLFVERGYDRCTITEIAARAGVTERTFFRHFADKREVLFWGASALQEGLVDTVTHAPASLSPLDAVLLALESTSPLFHQNREQAKTRSTLIATHAELQERELRKLAVFSAEIAHALRRRGVEDPAATLTAETGMLLFKVALERWAQNPEQADLSQHLRESLHGLRTVVGPPPAETRSSPSRKVGPSRSKPPRSRGP